jgi:hypothetical protein
MLANKLRAYPVPDNQTSEEEHRNHPAVVDFFECWLRRRKGTKEGHHSKCTHIQVF